MNDSLWKLLVQPGAYDLPPFDLFCEATNCLTSLNQPTLKGISCGPVRLGAFVPLAVLD